MDNERHIDHFEPSVAHGVYRLKGEPLPAMRTQLCYANILEVTAATNGYCGGDTGHGGRTVISFRDLGGTDIQIREFPKEISNGGVEIILGGDSELCTIRDACEFIVNALDKLVAQQSEKREKDKRRLESRDDDDE